MNAMSRRTFLGGVLLITTGGVLLAACSTTGPPPPIPTPAALPTSAGQESAVPASAVPVKLSGKVVAWVPPSCYLCEAQALWNKAHPETPLEIVKTGAGGTNAAGTAKYEAALRAGSGGPDIYQSNPDEIAKDLLHKQLYDWTDRIAPLKSGFVPAKLQECTHPKTGRIYGFPFQIGMVGMYYREDLMQ